MKRIASMLLLCVLMLSLGSCMHASPALSSAKAQANITWNKSVIEPAIGAGSASSLALDSFGYPHICYLDMAGNLKYASLTDSGWNIQIVEESVGTWWYGEVVSLALDSSNNPHISYRDGYKKEGILKYAHWNGSSWDIEIVDAPGYGTGLYNSIALNHYGVPRIAYFDGPYGTYGDLKCALRQSTGVWDIRTISTSWAAFYGISISSCPPGYDFPSISYVYSADGTNFELRFVKGQEGHWLPPETVDAISASTTGVTSLAHSSIGENFPRISYDDGSNVKYASWTGSFWDIKTVDTGGSRGWSSLALDSNNRARISYYDFVNNDLKYARWIGYWNIQTVGTAVFSGLDTSITTSIALDSSGNPHISYCSNDRLKFAEWVQFGPVFGWLVQFVDPGPVGLWSSIALVSFNEPHVSYCDYTGSGGLKYAKNWGWWIRETVDSTGPGEFSSLAVDTGNNPHISYYANGDLKYARWTGSAWSIQTVDATGDVGYYTSLALDSGNKPHISYMDHANLDLKYARWTGSDWNIQTVDATGDTGFATSLALDSSGYPHISYCDRTNGDLRYARWTGSAWIIQTVDSTGDVGMSTSLALDSFNKPHISYSDDTNGNLKYARWTGVAWDIQTVDTSVYVSYFGTSLALDDYNDPHISYYDSVNAQLKYATAMISSRALLESRQDTGASSNLGTITFDGTSYSLPNEVPTPAGSYQAKYTAASSTYSFDHWETTGALSVSNAYNNPTTVTVSGDGTLRAVYKAYLPISFADGFESGSFSRWSGTSRSSGETATVVSTRCYRGTYSARFSSNGTGGSEYAYCYKSITSSAELYARGYFFVSQSGIVDNDDRFYFLAVFAGSNGVAYAGWRKTGGIVKWTLVIRHGTSSVLTYSTSSPMLNRWYCVELHWKKDGVNGLGELWIDGVRVCSITGKNTTAYGDASRVRFGLAALYYCGATIAYADCAKIAGTYIGPEPPGTVFEDGFESGNFGRWSGTSRSSGETATVVNTLKHRGAYSARFTSNGNASSEYAYCYKTVASSSELYARGYFYVSQSGIVDENDRFYFIVLAGTDSVAFAGWRKVSGVVKWCLVIRNGTSNVIAYSSASPSLNRWYCVELHWKKDAVNGLGELWVDGVRVCSIKGKNTAAFGNVVKARFGLPGIYYCGSTTVYCDDCVISKTNIGQTLTVSPLNFIVAEERKIKHP